MTLGYGWALDVFASIGAVCAFILLISAVLSLWRFFHPLDYTTVAAADGMASDGPGTYWLRDTNGIWHCIGLIDGKVFVDGTRYVRIMPPQPPTANSFLQRVN